MSKLTWMVITHPQTTTSARVAPLQVCPSRDRSERVVYTCIQQCSVVLLTNSYMYVFRIVLHPVLRIICDVYIGKGLANDPQANSY